MWSAIIVAFRIFAELANSLGSATVVGTRKISVYQTYALLSCMLKLLERTIAHRIHQLTWALPLRAPAETVECASRTIEDGGRERLWSGCEPNPVSADQMYSTHGTQRLCDATVILSERLDGKTPCLMHTLGNQLRSSHIDTWMFYVSVDGLSLCAIKSIRSLVLKSAWRGYTRYSIHKWSQSRYINTVL